MRKKLLLLFSVFLLHNAPCAASHNLSRGTFSDTGSTRSIGEFAVSRQQRGYSLWQQSSRGLLQHQKTPKPLDFTQSVASANAPGTHFDDKSTSQDNGSSRLCRGWSRRSLCSPSISTKSRFSHLSSEHQKESGYTADEEEVSSLHERSNSAISAKPRKVTFQDERRPYPTHTSEYSDSTYASSCDDPNSRALFLEARSRGSQEIQPCSSLLKLEATKPAHGNTKPTGMSEKDLQKQRYIKRKRMLEMFLIVAAGFCVGCVVVYVLESRTKRRCCINT